jgi:hypothetical protein
MRNDLYAALRACRSEGIDEPLTLRRYTVHPSKSIDQDFGIQ